MQREHQLTVTSVTVSGSTSLARHGCYIDEIGSCAYDRPKKSEACAGDGSRPGRPANSQRCGRDRQATEGEVAGRKAARQGGEENGQEGGQGCTRGAKGRGGSPPPVQEGRQPRCQGAVEGSKGGKKGGEDRDAEAPITLAKPRGGATGPSSQRTHAPASVGSRRRRRRQRHRFRICDGVVTARR